MKLTISMAAYDDFDGVYFTVQALRMYQALPAGTEILILDNNPGTPHSEAMHSLARGVQQMRIISIVDRKSSFVKYDAFAHCEGDVLLGLDCHLLLAPGFITALLAHWQAHPESHDMLTGPLIYNDLKTMSTSMDPEWRGSDFGTWSTDRKAMQHGMPFEVPMMGMGCFSFTRAGMVQVNPKMRGFGGEEWYMAEKVRANGGRVICHPSLGWQHRFDWPKRTFPLSSKDKMANYYRGWLELYGSLDHPRIVEMTEHWSKSYPRHEVLAIARSMT